MANRMKQITVFLEAIEEIKRRMVALESDPNVGFDEKTKRLDKMRETLRRTGWYTLDLLRQEQVSLKNGDGNDDGEEHG